jgi:pimeloyl-[acyl-carrier protein] methyl ester esterase
MTTDPNSGPRRPVLVLLHGFALHSGIWGDWPAELATVAEPHTIELPGHGTRPWDMRIRDLAGLARTIADHIPPAAIVLGWSLGGMIALELARQRPSTLRGLILVATTPRFVKAPDWPNGIEPGVLETFAEGVRRDYHRAAQDFLALQVLGTADPRATLRALRAGVRSRPAPDPRALETGLDILRRADLRGALGDIDLETLVISGQHDRLTHPAAGEFLASALPRARLLRIPGAGHAPFLSHPAAMRDELEALVDRVQQPAVRPASAAG